MEQMNHMDDRSKRMFNERDKMIFHLVDRIHEHDAMIRDLRATVARMQGIAMRQPFESGNGADMRLHTP